jgi:ATP-dependent DNA helicase RecQ
VQIRLISKNQNLPEIHHILKKFYGYSRFRPLQEDIISSVIKGNDTLALLPTGGGKSICFQVPALALEGICIVISPLIALMKDQVHQLQKRGIPAVYIYSGMNKKEIDIALDNCVYGNIKFLYVSPERLETEILIERVKKMKVCLLAVDEAHCISQWGYDFRPSYLKISDFKKYISGVPIIALTATATKEVKQDIADKLELNDPAFFQKSFARENLSYSCFFEEDKERKLLEILKNVPGTAVVYVRSRKKAKEVAAFLSKRSISATYYHAGLSNEQRSEIQDSWINNQIRVIVATNAFGMGIDKADVRVVIHLDLPDSLEAYYQEAGRAGRDEKKAYAVALFDENNTEDLIRRLETSYPSVEHIRKVYQSIANYYKIAVGSSMLSTYDFILDDFAQTFRLPIPDTYYALKRLEEGGFIQLNESFFNPSKVFIKVDHTTLYQFQVANIALDPLIKALLRSYGGELFTHFQTISEKQLATMLNLRKSEVEAKLETLDKMEIIIYEKQKDKPQLTFLTPRFDAGKLPFNSEAYKERKAKDLKKIKAVIQYVKNELRCRTQMLLEYFNEEKDETCGVCDNCIKRKKAVSNQQKDEILMNLINSRIENGPVHIEELIEELKNKREEVLQVIRKMLESGILSTDGEKIFKL